MLDLKEYEKLIRESQKQTDLFILGNTVLYKMCEDNRGHVDQNIIVSKIWLIGRAYAASVERRKNKEIIFKNTKEFYLSLVNNLDDWLELDSKINNLKSEDQISEKNISELLKLHYCLIQILKKETGFGNRSFASKYLHFHLPELFYLYDSRADQSIRRLIPKNKSVKNKIDISCTDKVYAEFFLKVFLFTNECKKEGIGLNPRQVDTFLLNYYEQFIEEKK